MRFLLTFIFLIVLVIIGLVYYETKKELDKISFSVSFKNIDISKVSLLKGNSTMPVNFALTIFNQSNLNLNIENAAFKIYYKGVKIGESTEKISLTSQPNKIEAYLIAGNLFLSTELMELLRDYMFLGKSFEIQYSVNAKIWGFPLTKTGVATIKKENN